MKSTPDCTPDLDVHDLPLATLQARADRACLGLREARARFTADIAIHVMTDRPSRSGLQRMRALDQALDAVERVLPGFTDPPRTVLARTIFDLTPVERVVLREALSAERAARERLARLLGEVAPEDVEDALARVGVREQVTAELSALFHEVDRVRAAADAYAASASQS